MTSKRRLLQRLAWISLATAALSALMLFACLSLNRNASQRRNAEFVERQTALLQECRTFLKTTAAKIRHLPVDPAIVGQVEAHYFEQYSRARLNLWAMDLQDAFLFGVPREAFTRLNGIFDRYRQAIEKEGLFTDRQDFLRQLIEEDDRQRWTEYEDYLSGQSALRNRDLRSYWRSSGDDGYMFAAPLQNDQEKMLGTLYLKVTHLDQEGRWGHNEYEPFLTLSGLLLGISLLFLWFLLPTWVYLDATSRGIAMPARWSLLTMFSLIFGLTVYLILRPEERS